MIRKILFGAAACILFAGAADSKAASHSKGERSSFSMQRITAGGELVANGKTFKIGLPEEVRKLRAKRNVDVTDVIDNPSGKPQEYSKTSGGYYYYGSYAPYMDAGQAATIYWDGDEAYIYNILSYKETFTYVLGEKKEGRLAVPMNQTVANGDGFDINLGLLRTELLVGKNPEWQEGDDEDEEYVNYINFTYNEDFDEAYYSIAADGTLTLELPDAPEGGETPDDGYTHLDPEEYGFPDYALGFYYTDDLTWTGDCDIYQIYEEFNYELVRVPEGVEFRYYSYVNSYDMGVLVNVARVGDTLYFKGLSAYAPESVFKAYLVQTEEGLMANVPQKQFIGASEDGYYNLITRTLVYDPQQRDYVLADDDVDAQFSVLTDEAGNITAINAVGFNVLVFNYANNDYDPYDEFPGVNLVYQASLAGTPLTPEGAYFEDHSAWLGANYLFFYLTQFSTEGTILDVNELYYRIYVNGEPFEFMQHNGTNLKGDDVSMYVGITRPTTLIPYTFYNGLDLFSDEFHLFYVGFYTTDIETIGVEAVYRYGDTETTSERVTLNVSKVEAVDAEAVATEYYTLQGVRADKAQGGIFIERTLLSDGTVRTAKVVR